MKDIGSREFQISYQKLKDPVRVVARSGTSSRTIGHFYPGELPPTEGRQDSLFGDEPEQPGGDAGPAPDELEDIL